MSENSLSAGYETPLRRVLAALKILAGWFTLYVAAGGLLGFAVTRPYMSAPTCFPYLSAFETLQTNCSSEAVNAFWAAIIGIPRVLVLLPALFVASVESAFLGNGPRWISDAACWLCCSIPFIAVSWAGLRWWWRRNRAIAIGALVMILGEILALGLMG